MFQKLVNFIKGYQQDIILVAGVVLVSLLSFALGYIMAIQQNKAPVQSELNESSYCRGRG